jgi:hypothetical protein
MQMLAAGVAPQQGPTKYIVVDHVQRLVDDDTIAALLRLPELTGKPPAPYSAMILIKNQDGESSSGWHLITCVVCAR